jgi:hypothetical protein
MCHIDLDGQENWEMYGPVPCQYERTFTGQSTGTVSWEIRESMAEFYESDRENAKKRKTGQGKYEHAVFATDKQFNEGSGELPWPVKSGYYFNPGGTYRCTVETQQYKDDPHDTEPTQEHLDLVQLVKEAFYYDSKLIYNDNTSSGYTLGDITLEKPRGLLQMAEKYSLLSAGDLSLETTLERDCAVEEVHPLLREVLEGWDKSDTEDSYRNFQYREYTDKEIYYVKEKTVLLFKVGVPEGKKLYTHVNMPNGNYAVQTKVKDIKFNFDSYLELKPGDLGTHNGEQTMSGFTMDGIPVSVRGSMYDDRN